CLPFLFQTFLNLGNTLLKLTLLGICPSAQDQSHGQIVRKLMFFTERDCGISLACDSRSVPTKLVHPEDDRSCHCFAERMLRCISITASLSANPQGLLGIAEEPQCHAVVQPYMNSRVLCREVKIRRSLAVFTHANAAFQRRVRSGKFSVCK